MGTAIGSLAYTICNGGYRLKSSANFSIVECLENGYWSEGLLECAPIVRDNILTCSTILGMLGTLCFLVTLGTAIVFVVVIICIKYNTKQEVPVIYDSISHTTVGRTQVESSEQKPLQLPPPRVQLESNPAYDHKQRS